MKGLEPPLLTEPDPKSGAATNYATCANAVQRYDYFSNFQNFKENTYTHFKQNHITIYPSGNKNLIIIVAFQAKFKKAACSFVIESMTN